MPLDEAVCDRARIARDARFDGRFFIGVLSTGIYCRPICPAPQPKRRNIRYFPSAAAAAEAGLRPCLRCRPETAPGTPAWNGTSATVTRALRLIGEGALDEGSVDEVAASLGVSARHLDRLFVQHLGAPPVAVAQTRRLHFAKQLISDTDLPMTRVALASGFGSIRRFNDTFRKLYGRTPSELRRAQSPAAGAAEGHYLLHLSYRPPYDWESLLDFLAARATPGVEEVVAGAYRRTLAVGGRHGVLEVGHLPRRRALELRVRFPEPAALLGIVARARALFDLAADPGVVGHQLRRDGLLGRMIKKRPGLRVPGAWDGFELAVRAILGQQVTVRGATTLAGRVAARFGTRLTFPDRGGLTHVFPDAEALAEARLAGLPQMRAGAIRGLASAVVAGEVSFSAAVTGEELRTRLTRLPGIGDWTAEYVAMRALGEPDAFPADDLVLQRAVGNGTRLSPAALVRRAEAWRPWRAYAALHLWRAAAEEK